jgi:hypothetical protein
MKCITKFKHLTLRKKLNRDRHNTNKSTASKEKCRLPINLFKETKFTSNEQLYTTHWNKERKQGEGKKERKKERKKKEGKNKKEKKRKQKHLTFKD